MIYLDNAATTYPKPKEVIKAIRKSLKTLGANPGRSGYKMAIDTASAVFESRQYVADFFGVSNPENVVFTLNCTQALNICIKGLAKNNGNFVCSDLEHNAVMRPLEKLKNEGISDYKCAHIDIKNDEITVKNFDRLIDEKTSAVILTAASNVFGVVTPFKKIASLCKKRGVKIVIDASQVSGILPINCGHDDIDFLCVAAHKGLYAPMGTGILVINSDEKLSTLFEGGTGSDSLSLLQPAFNPDRFESGTGNTAGIIAIKSGIKRIKELGMGNIYSHEYSLLKIMENELKNMKNIRLFTSFSKGERLVPVLSFNIEGMNSEMTALGLSEKNICVRAGYHCAPCAHRAFGTLETGTVRISPSIFTKKSDIYFTINCINKLQNK